ncbi:hypothetical protein CN899_08035 [Bacillus thuringiensis]|uniref:Uncharacterized protein n=1 Tax=Bacillus thuringiensis TaxID=1428 RepID=A0A9X7C171_BACTU|nr:hypothetical protein CN899_08035 [Bacillus thuringiensis]
MQTLRDLKFDLYIYLPAFIYFSFVFSSIYMIGNEFHLMSFIMALLALCCLVSSIIDIKKKKYKITKKR